MFQSVHWNGILRMKCEEKIEDLQTYLYLFMNTRMWLETLIHNTQNRVAQFLNMYYTAIVTTLLLSFWIYMPNKIS